MILILHLPKNILCFSNGSAESIYGSIEEGQNLTVTFTGKTAQQRVCSHSIIGEAHRLALKFFADAS
jgi:hypothetical protein